MESRFGTGFADVRIHNDGAAQRSAKELGAQAYTSGNHIVLGSGSIDDHVLAHELTHVVQQRAGQVAGTDRGDGLRVSDPSDAFEREAEAVAKNVMRLPTGRSTVTTGSAPLRPGDSLQLRGKPKSEPNEKANLPSSKAANGTTKSFFPDPDNPEWGWLELEDELLWKAEIAALTELHNLVGISKFVPDFRIEPTPGARQTFLEGKNRRYGWWTQKINIVYEAFGRKGGTEESLSIKPLMMNNGVSSRSHFHMICITLEQEGGMERLTTLHNDLTELSKTLGDVLKIVSEFTLGIDRDTGEVYILDVGPPQGYKGGKKPTSEGNAKGIAKGMENMINHVKKRILSNSSNAATAATGTGSSSSST